MFQMKNRRKPWSKKMEITIKKEQHKYRKKHRKLNTDKVEECIRSREQRYIGIEPQPLRMDKDGLSEG